MSAKQFVDCLWWGESRGPGGVAPTSAIFAQRIENARLNKKETIAKVDKQLAVLAFEDQIESIRRAKMAERASQQALVRSNSSIGKAQEGLLAPPTSGQNVGPDKRKKPKIKSYVPKPPGYSTRPLSARADMRRGFTLGPKIPRAMHKSSDDTPGPAGYDLNFTPGSIGNMIGEGKNPYSREVHDALCWAGSWVTTRAAPISPKKTYGSRAEPVNGGLAHAVASAAAPHPPGQAKNDKVSKAPAGAGATLRTTRSPC